MIVQLADREQLKSEEERNVPRFETPSIRSAGFTRVNVAPIFYTQEMNLLWLGKCSKTAFEP